MIFSSLEVSRTDSPSTVSCRVSGSYSSPPTRISFCIRALSAAPRCRYRRRLDFTRAASSWGW